MTQKKKSDQTTPTLDEIIEKMDALAAQTPERETTADRRAREKAERAQQKVALLAGCKMAVETLKKKRVAWRDIAAMIKNTSGVSVSVRELKEAVGEAPQKKSPRAPQTPSPAEQNVARSDTPAAAPRTAPAANAARKSE